MQTVTLAERPDLADEAFAIPYDVDAPAFMQGSPVSLLPRRTRLARRWPHHVVVLLDNDGTPLARGVSIPFAVDDRERDHYPYGGWDQIAIWAAEDALDGRATDTVCALEIAVHPAHRRRGLSGVVLRALRDNARAHGHTRLTAPVRPPAKAAEPTTPMPVYQARTRDDGLPADPWLRVHVRHGGRIVTTAPCSATVQAPLRHWRDWTGLPFDTDGDVIVPGALVPVLVSTTHDIAVYVEPNVWVLHTLTDPPA